MQQRRLLLPPQEEGEVVLVCCNDSAGFITIPDRIDRLVLSIGRGEDLLLACDWQ